MKIKTSYIIGLTTLFISQCVAVNGYSQTAEEICKKHIENVGGSLYLNKLNNMVIDQQLLMNNTEFAQNVVVVNNKSYYIKTKYPGKTSIVAVKDTTGWQINPFVSGGEKPTLMKRKEVDVIKYQSDLAGPLHHSNEKGISIKLLGKESINGEETFKLLVTYKTGYFVNIFISSKSYMIKRILDKYKLVNYSDYKKVDGISFPFVTEIKYQNQALMFSVIKIKTNQTIDENIFLFPTEKE